MQAHHHNPSPHPFQAPACKAPWWYLFVLLCLGLFCLLNYTQVIPLLMGFGPLPKWLDAHAILAALDAQRAGLNVYAPNPLDLLKRGHAYSSLWLQLGHFDLGRPQLNGFAYFSLSLFFLPLLAGLRPSNRAEFCWLSAFLLSSGVLLALFRANNDLIIFGLLAAMLFTLQHRSLWVKSAAPLFLCLAAGLKYYPIIALCVIFTEPNRQHRRVLLGLCAAGLCLTAYSIRENFGHLPELYSVAGAYYSFGLQTPLKLMGLSANAAAWIPLLLGSAIAATALLAKPEKAWLAALAPDWRYRSFLVASALLAGCYWLEANWSYRLIFLVGMIPLLAAPPALESAPAWFRRLLGPMKLLVVLTMIQGTLAAPLTIALARLGADSLAMNLWAFSSLLQHAIHLPLACFATFMVALPILANFRRSSA